MKRNLTLSAHLRFVSRWVQVKTLPLIPTPKDSFDTSYSSVIALRRVANGNFWYFSEIPVGLNEISLSDFSFKYYLQGSIMINMSYYIAILFLLLLCFGFVMRNLSRINSVL